VAFPAWVPPRVREQAAQMNAGEAQRVLGVVLEHAERK